MTIALLSSKGGTGKSTVSILLHEAFRHAQKSVAVLDWDSQGTSNKSLVLIGGQKADTGAGYDVLIYDTPPSLEHPATAAAALAADVAIVLATPSPADVWEAEVAIQFLKKNGGRALPRVLFNKVRKTTLLGRLVDESAKQVSAPTLPVMLSARECYQHAIGQGWKALDSAAREEVLQLAIALLSLST